MRYAAPDDVTEVYLSSGPLAVIDGFVDVPVDASTGDLAGMAANGFYLAPQASVKPEAKAPPATKSDLPANSTSDDKTT